MKHPPLNSRVLGYALIVLTLVSVGLGVKANTDRNAVVRCLTGYIAENKRVTDTVRAASLKREAQVDAVITGTGETILAPPPKNAAEAAKRAAATDKKLRATFGMFEETKRALAAERANNPPPALPGKCSDFQ